MTSTNNQPTIKHFSYQKTAPEQAHPDTIQNYVETIFRPDFSVMNEIIARAKAAGLPDIHVPAMDALHLEILTRIAQPSKVVEIGTLAGFSTLALAKALAPQGKIYTFEFNSLHARIARETFQKYGYDHCIEVIEGPAQEKLNQINSQGPFDLVFLDADKLNYPTYLKWIDSHLRSGGLLIADNTFGWGLIDADSGQAIDLRPSIQGLREFNRQVAQSGLYRATIFPTGEGLTVAVKV